MYVDLKYNYYVWKCGNKFFSLFSESYRINFLELCRSGKLPQKNKYKIKKKKRKMSIVYSSTPIWSKLASYVRGVASLNLLTKVCLRYSHF